MKKLMILSAVTFILAAKVNAQTTEVYVKNDIIQLKNQESVIRKEKLEDKRELRKLEGNEVSYQSKQQFYVDFGDIPEPQWERTANFDEATFSKDGQVLTAFMEMIQNW